MFRLKRLCRLECWTGRFFVRLMAADAPACSMLPAVVPRLWVSAPHAGPRHDFDRAGGVDFEGQHTDYSQRQSPFSALLSCSPPPAFSDTSASRDAVSHADAQWSVAAGQKVLAKARSQSREPARKRSRLVEALDLRVTSNSPVQGHGRLDATARSRRLVSPRVVHMAPLWRGTCHFDAVEAAASRAPRFLRERYSEP